MPVVEISQPVPRGIVHDLRRLDFQDAPGFRYGTISMRSFAVEASAG